MLARYVPKTSSVPMLDLEPWVETWHLGYRTDSPHSEIFLLGPQYEARSQPVLGPSKSGSTLKEVSVFTGFATAADLMNI